MIRSQLLLPLPLVSTLSTLYLYPLLQLQYFYYSGEYSEFSLFVSFDTITVLPQHVLPQLQYYISFSKIVLVYYVFPEF